MEAKQIQLGYEELKQEIEPLWQSFYVTVSRPAEEALVLAEVLSEISLQRQSKALYYYALRNFSGEKAHEIIGLEDGRAQRFEDDWQKWRERLRQSEKREEALLEMLEYMRQAWPEQITYTTALTDALLQDPREPNPAQYESLFPQKLNQTRCPVILHREPKELDTQIENGVWQIGELARALGGYLLIDARHLYAAPLIWQSLIHQLAQQQCKVQLVLYGPASLYELWRSEDEDFAAFFTEVRCFPTRVPNSWPNRQRWLTYLRDQLDPIITDKALEFLLALISGLSFAHMKDSDGFLPGRLDIAQPWIRECEWLCREKNTELINIALVKEVWENRQRRARRLEQALPYGLAPQKGRQIGSVYTLTLHDIGYCTLCEPVHVQVHPKKEGKRRARRQKDEFDVLLECEREIEEDAGSIKTAIAFGVLSAMGHYPVRQSLAIIGEMDESGVLQPDQAAAQLVTGFYEVCRREGCENGGVLLPAASMLDLKLPEEVQQALREKRFFLYPVRTMLEGAEILMK
ncbi:MAG: hypothetical protein HFE64_05645 [Lachnospiraceae bacterium]|jgi:hypothetical protein|nr:hypothetical protein [Lachnospiraceae bacterium]